MKSTRAEHSRMKATSPLSNADLDRRPKVREWCAGGKDTNELTGQRLLHVGGQVITGGAFGQDYDAGQRSHAKIQLTA